MILSSTIISQFELFKALDKPSLERVTTLMRPKFVEKDQYIISAGSDNADVFFLITGQVLVCYFAQNGKQVNFENLQPGTMFGELAAIDDKGRSSDCITVSDCQLAVLSKDVFWQLVHEFPQVREYVLIRLAQMVRFNMRRVYEFTAFTVPQRIRFELLRLASESSSPDGPIRIKRLPTHEEIAGRISTHREAVSREVNSLIARGLISSDSSGYLIHDVVAMSDTKS
ncbi:MAG: Crp/Fnr family transcriptional regulator [Granulosicoccus sp.]|nr:Crp/Fnr family transcriptional regulator [Granulosicoccus sp.]